jgi:hypothetical protein
MPVLGPLPDTQLRPTVGMPTTVTLAGFDIAYGGRTFDGTNWTFEYTVSRDEEQQASFFSLQVPNCAPELVAYSPGGASIHFDAGTGRTYVKWAFSLSAGESRTFSYTFAGDAGEVEEGLVWTWAKSSSVTEEGVLVGPCGGYFVAGTVFTDADSNSVQTVEEAGIPDVTVDILDSDGGVESQQTDTAGNYSFWVIDGYYTVRILFSTPDDDFNEELAESFIPTTDTSMSVTVPPDATDVDFGFRPNTKKILDDFDAGELTTTGEPVRFWKKQLRAAIQGRETADGPPEIILGYLTQIEGLFLDDPYQFTDQSELEEALAILSDNSKAEVVQLQKVLLAAELNFVSGRTLNDLELQEVLLAWGESLVIEHLAASSQSSWSQAERLGVANAPLARPGGDLHDAIALMDAMNGGTGGGGGEE